MSNYDWYDDYDPYEKDKRAAPEQHCGSTKEHTGHIYGTVYPRESGPRPNPPGLSRTYVSTPFFKCPGTLPRVERFLDMMIRFHDDGKVTWAQPGNVALEIEKTRENRKEAARVALQKEQD